MKRHALIAGVSGIIGRHLAEHLLATDKWTVTGISRHKHDLPKGVKHIAVDLTDADATKAANGTTRVAVNAADNPGPERERHEKVVNQARALRLILFRVLHVETVAAEEFPPPPVGGSSPLPG